MSHERELYRIEDLPIFQNRVYDTPAEARACPRGDVCLVQSPTTGLIYNAAFRPELLTYDPHYQNEQAVSPRFRRHLDDVARIVEHTMGRRELVEVGCGKGSFLELMVKRGAEMTGFDPTYEGRNPRIKRQFFAVGVGIKARGIVLRHVLEHVNDPSHFLHDLRLANGGSGLIYIEVPCFDWICTRRAWFDIYYEHVNYFRFTDFPRMFDKVISQGFLFDGQYQYVVADLASLREPQASEADRIAFPTDFLQNLHTDSPDGPAAVWGGASKGVIFSLLRERLGRPIKRMIDINPAKQGKYIPGTGLRVEAPGGVLPSLPAGSTIYVMNSNYLAEIRDMSSNAYHYVSIDHE